MTKKYVFSAAMFLIMYGTTTSMMVSKKIKNKTLRLNRLQSNNVGQTDLFEKIAQSLQNMEAKLEKQNRLLQNLQSNLISNSGIHTQAYAAFQMAKMEDDYKLYEAQPSIEQEWAMKSVKIKNKE